MKCWWEITILRSVPVAFADWKRPSHVTLAASGRDTRRRPAVYVNDHMFFHSTGVFFFGWGRLRFVRVSDPFVPPIQTRATAATGKLQDGGHTRPATSHTDDHMAAQGMSRYLSSLKPHDVTIKCLALLEGTRD